MKTITRFFFLVAALAISVCTFAQPTAAPTAPASRPTANVISIYGSDTYTAITGVNTFPDWGQLGQGSSFSTYTIATTTHNVIKYGKLSYQGIDFSGNPQDVSVMKYLHLDVWTADAAATPLSIAIINGNSNIAVNKTITTTGTWTSIDIPLTEFTGQNLSAINQLMFKSTEWSTNATNLLAKDIYVDNIYFWTDVTASLTTSTTKVDLAQPANSTGNFNVTATQNWTASSNQSWLTVAPESGTSAGATITLTATANTTYINRTATVTVLGNDATTKTVTVTQAGLPIPAAPVPTQSSDNVMSIFSETYTAVPNVLQGWHGNTFSTVMLGGNETLKNTSTCCMGYELTGKPINMSTMAKLHVDIYAESITSITIGLVTTAENKKAPISLTAGQWNSLDINLSDFPGADLTKVNQIGFWDLNGTFYLDNLYFYKVITSVDNVTNKPLISFFPNPVSNALSIKAESVISELTIRNLVGQAIKTVTVNANSKTIDLSNFASGNYFIVAKMANGQISTQKISKL